MTATLGAGDAAGFVSAFAPSARGLAERLARTLVQFLPVTWQRTGPDTTVTWSFAGSRVSHRVALETDPQSQISGIRPVGVAAPWLVAPVSLVTAPGVVAIAAADAQPWLAAAGFAVTRLREVNLGPLARQWRGEAVVAIPPDAAGFATAAGLPATAAQDTIAATHQLPGGLTVISVNPRFATAGEDELRATLLHELVHQATGSPTLSSPTWVIEGLAEYVAVSSLPAARTTRDQTVRRLLNRDGIPASLPADAAFTGPRQREAYALASVAVEAIVAEVGWDRTVDIVAGRASVGPAGPTDRQLLSWYREALSRL